MAVLSRVVDGIRNTIKVFRLFEVLQLFLRVVEALLWVFIRSLRVIAAPSDAFDLLGGSLKLAVDLHRVFGRSLDLVWFLG